MPLLSQSSNFQLSSTSGAKSWELHRNYLGFEVFSEVREVACYCVRSLDFEHSQNSVTGRGHHVPMARLWDVAVLRMGAPK